MTSAVRPACTSSHESPSTATPLKPSHHRGQEGQQSLRIIGAAAGVAIRRSACQNRVSHRTCVGRLRSPAAAESPALLSTPTVTRTTTDARPEKPQHPQRPLKRS
eukprot:3241162-Rhodomonas_salina.3